MINNVGIDFIDQVAIQTSNFAADKGRNAGASINVVTKSGTKSFGGSVFETYRNDKFHSPNYFAPKDPSASDQGERELPRLRRRLWRPDRRNKLFFSPAWSSSRSIARNRRSSGCCRPGPS